MTTIIKLPSLILSNTPTPHQKPNLSLQNRSKTKSIAPNRIKFDQKRTKTDPIDPKPVEPTTVSISGDGLWTRVPSKSVACRLSKLVREFRSLPEAVDRVRRLLEYGSLLGAGDLSRSELNRVPGCAARVWVEVEMDEFGRVWFRADSDSEITKGFCSCLIYLLDGSFPLDILKVKAEDLADMNVGLPVRSRVNSWHNVLVYMQDRTKTLISS